MIMKKFTSLMIAAALATQVTAQSASASGVSSNPQPSVDSAPACGPSLEMSLNEQQSFLMFNAYLSHLLNDYGTPKFESHLQTIVAKNFPSGLRLGDVSPLFFMRVRNLVDQARFKNVIAKTIGLDDKDYLNFEWHMRFVTLHQEHTENLKFPFKTIGVKLIQKLKAAQLPAAINADPAVISPVEMARAEAIMRTSDMYTYMAKMRNINGQLIDERAAASARVVATLAIGAVGVGILYSTLVISAPIVGAAGAAAGSLSSNSTMALLLSKVGEIAAGSSIGLIGSPAAKTTFDAYHTLTESAKQSANNNSNYLCEIDKQIVVWKQNAPRDLFSAALVGAGMGAGGGALTLSKTGAKVVLSLTAAGVAVAQAYSLYKTGIKTVMAVRAYEMAAEADRNGDREKSEELLREARDLAQEAGEMALEAAIVGTLTMHVGHHGPHAWQHGASEIRKLYAASADTLPTAASAAIDMAKGVSGTN